MACRSTTRSARKPRSASPGRSVLFDAVERDCVSAFLDKRPPAWPQHRAAGRVVKVRCSADNWQNIVVAPIVDPRGGLQALHLPVRRPVHAGLATPNRPPNRPPTCFPGQSGHQDGAYWNPIIRYVKGGAVRLKRRSLYFQDAFGLRAGPGSGVRLFQPPVQPGARPVGRGARPPVDAAPARADRRAGRFADHPPGVVRRARCAVFAGPRPSSAVPCPPARRTSTSRPWFAGNQTAAFAQLFMPQGQGGGQQLGPGRWLQRWRRNSASCGPPRVFNDLVLMVLSKVPETGRQGRRLGLHQHASRPGRQVSSWSRPPKRSASTGRPTPAGDVSTDAAYRRFSNGANGLRQYRGMLKALTAAAGIAISAAGAYSVRAAAALSGAAWRCSTSISTTRRR